MRILVQRVKNARVRIAGKDIAAIGYGLLIFVGVGKGDEPGDIEKIAKKILNLRIFDDDDGKMNLNVRQVNGQIMIPIVLHMQN